MNSAKKLEIAQISEAIADQWNRRAGDLAKWANDHLVNRRDAFGRYVAVENRTADRSNVFTDKSGLTRDILECHFRGKSTGDVIGLHSTVRDEAAGDGEVAACWSRWFAYDIDRHADATDPEANLKAVLALHDRLVALGFRVLLSDSGGNGGYHLLILFDAPVLTEKVYAFARWLVRDWQALGLDKDPESFPKQASIKPGGFGNWLRLPGRHHTRDHFTRVWDGSAWLEGEAAIDYILATEGSAADRIPAKALESPKVVRKSRRASSKPDVEYDAREARRAIGYLPDPDADYAMWVKVGMCLAKLGRVGFDIWEEWSARGSKYREDVCDAKWRTFDPPSSNADVSLGTFFMLAKDRGFEFEKTKSYVGSKVVTPSSGRPVLHVVNGHGYTVDGASPDAGKSLDRLEAIGVEPPPWTPPAEPKEAKADRCPGEFPLTDMGNGERLVHQFGDRIRYVHQWKKWLCYDGRRWVVDNAAAVAALGKRTVRSIYAEAQRAKDDKDRREIAKWALESEGRSRVDAMLVMASREDGIPALPEQLDRDPWTLNCRNGTIDLRTGKLRPHDRADMLTKMAPVDFDPDAQCSLFDETLQTFLVTPGLIDFCQRLWGMAISGVVDDHVLPICYGTGSNGKSTILGALMEAVGLDYAMKAAPDLLIAKKGETHPTDRADLFGKRLVIAIETEDGQRLNESLVKELTGGDRIRARRMREDFWEFEPTHTVILATNHKPQVRGTDHGIWRRLKLVPFSVQMSDNRAKKDVPRLLKKELPGILAWLVRGCLAWQAEGLNPPDEVKEATKQYREDEDVLGVFLDEHCVLNPNAKVKSGQLYGAYKSWSEVSGFGTLSLTKFGKIIEERGHPKTRSGGIWYHGIGLCANSGVDPHQHNDCDLEHLEHLGPNFGMNGASPRNGASTGKSVPSVPGVPISVPKVVEPFVLDAVEWLTAVPDSESPIQQAADWLMGYLAVKPAALRELLAKAQGDGLPETLLRSAIPLLSICVTLEGDVETWALPASFRFPAAPMHVANFREVGEL